MASERQHVEVVITLRPGADADGVADELRQHGLQVVPLSAGLLVTGAEGKVRTALAAEHVREHVESVADVPLKRLHGAD
jgi:hypothetical protein